MVELPLPSVTTLLVPTRPDVPGAAAGVAPVLKVMVWPSTVRVSPLAIVAPIESVFATFSNLVLPVSAAGAARLLLTAVPTNEAEETVPPPNRLAAVAPDPSATVRLDFEG